MFDATTTTDTAVNLPADEATTQQDIDNTPDPYAIGTDDAWACMECGFIAEESGGPLYECGGCGTLFNRDNSRDGCSHRCPDCGKFAGRIADHSCPDCGMAEAEVIEAVQCPECSDAVNVENWEDHWADYHANDQRAQP